MGRKRKDSVRVPYARAVYGKEEVRAVLSVLQDPLRLSPGPRVKAFEKKIATLFGKKYATMVNSGSSANLLALESLKLPAGSEVITPVLTFSTTLAPILQLGLTPVFVDVEEGTYVVDVDAIERAITGKTRALMIPSLLGNIPDLARLQLLARKHNLFVIEDSCDTLGARFNGRPTGAYTDISTTSFYASHIITAAATGGMVCLHDAEKARTVLVKSSWGRDSTLFGFHDKSEDIQKRFAGKVEDQPYDAKFVFSEVGYNFQPTEMSAAFGLEQLKKLSAFSRARRRHFKRLTTFFMPYKKWFTLPHQDARTQTNWLAFPLTIKQGAPFSRMEITRFLEENGIQTRPIFTGNVLRQPAFSYLKKRNPQDFPIADTIMRNGFLIGCHHGLSEKELRHLESTLTKFFKKVS